jgi:hypothetical protein
MATDQQSVTSLDAYDDLVEGYFARGETDGFPVIPVYREGLDAMLAGCDRQSDGIIGRFGRRAAPVTVGDVAEQALMAGCLPEYMPIVLAAFEILLEPSFGTERWAASTGGYFPWVIVNGPIRTLLGINCRHNVMGQGFRPNATIAGAIRLGLHNLGGFRQGTTDRSTISTAWKWAGVVGEDEEQSPWPPLHVDRGYQSQDSTVTVVVGRHPRHFTHQLSLVPEELLLSYGEELSTVGNFSSPIDDADDPLNGLSEDAARDARGAIIFIGEDHRGYFRDRDWSKRQMQDFLLQKVGRRVRDIRAAGIAGPNGVYTTMPEDARVPLCARPDKYLIVSAGSGGGRAMPGRTFGPVVTRKIEPAAQLAPLSDSPIAPHIAIVNRYIERGATDGKPIMPPTAARLQPMIEASGHPADEIVGTKFGFPEATSTVKDVAVNALMAGCRPEYMPLVLAAARILLSNPSTGMASTGSHWPSLIVNGPIRRQLGILSTFGPGSRANITIGRALQLCIVNIGRFKPAVLDKSAIGAATKFNLALIGENEEDSPWAPLHTTFGFQAQDSTVMALGDHSALSVNHEATTPEELLRSIVEDLCTAQVYDAPSVNQGGHEPAPLRDARRGGTANRSGGGGGAILYVGGRHRDVFRTAGWDRPAIQEFVAEHLGRTVADVRSRGYSGGRLRPDQLDTDFLGRLANPANVVILSAGGSGSYTLVNRGGAGGHGIQLIPR